jgi:hypothetical protein
MPSPRRIARFPRYQLAGEPLRDMRTLSRIHPVARAIESTLPIFFSACGNATSEPSIARSGTPASADASIAMLRRRTAHLPDLRLATSTSMYFQ